MDTIHLSPSDNIVVLARSLPEGAIISIQERKYFLEKPLGPGHKIALKEIISGEKIIKYGVPIGSAIFDIPAGSHVHLHNMRSDYLPTFTLEDGRKFSGTL